MKEYLLDYDFFIISKKKIHIFTKYLLDIYVLLVLLFQTVSVNL